MLGVIGGTGLYKMEALSGIKSISIETPFGKPSAPISQGVFEGQTIAFLPRHGMHHEFLPSEINYRANLWGLKSLGVTQVLSVSAVGSLEEAVKPGELAVPSQYFDWTRGKRAGTFFGDGLVGHISGAEPSCESLRQRIEKAAKKTETKVHFKKTYACVEGPRLGTRAESFFLQKAGCHLVGMTNVPEAFLAREAQMCYATIAVVTDYDCWMEDPTSHVSVDKVMQLYFKTIGKVQDILKEVFINESSISGCACRTSLTGALVTQEVPLKHQKMLEVLKR